MVAADRIERERRVRLLMLCTGNACRSQMAEGWARELHGRSIEVFSAGIEAHDGEVVSQSFGKGPPNFTAHPDTRQEDQGRTLPMDRIVEFSPVCHHR